MIDTAIIGAGLSGLAIARQLGLQGRSFKIYEARDRIGGRILTDHSERNQMALDMGPTWYWPETQPRMTRLIEELGLHSFAQHDEGKVLQLNDPNSKPEVLDVASIHGGARRLQGGMSTLVAALAQGLSEDQLQLDYALKSLTDKGDHVLLQFEHQGTTAIVQARRVILAIPPRLVAERVILTPMLDTALMDAMADTPTWMASQAKAMVSFHTPFWRADGQSGNAFVNHAQMVLSEIFDACDATGEQAALGGFFALPPALRQSFKVSMPMLLESQLVQVYDFKALDGEITMQDWATEPFTASALDQTPPVMHPDYGHPLLRQPLWQSRLLLGGSETASYGGGYMEGALEAAARIVRNLAYAYANEQISQQNPITSRKEFAMTNSHNEQCLSQFMTWATTQRMNAFERYRRHLNHDLATQHKEQLTQRALLATVEQIYSEALIELDQLSFDTRSMLIEQGRASLTQPVLRCFSGFSKAILDDAVNFNRNSCAISNFPIEHDPDAEYVQTISYDLAAAWKEFAMNVNALLIGKIPVAA
ncbi:flavin monoamine oxidase family protein [Ampullimonas aquatilis]|uniref:flavin monoamine oxidase family protein n=1 Tax=Ampullimonas aquatilis TaxID=1341549 RepID=UPI003C77F4BE